MSPKKPASESAPPRACKRCNQPGGMDGCGFRPTASGHDTRETCRDCEAIERSERRVRSNYASLKVEDFDVSVANDGRIDKDAAAQKRQEYSEAMGEFADELAATGGDPDEIAGDSGSYIGRLAEQERRFGNRRIARSVSLAAAHEALALRQFKDAAREYLQDKITPTGYALKPHNKTIRRTVVLHLSDLHLGADLKKFDNPRPFTAIEEARRLEYVVRQALDYKPQYREHSDLLLLLNGDLIEGLLMHDMRAGAPLTEQKIIFWRHFQIIMGLVSQQYPRVHVVCRPGNHGRDKLRHPGRATESKWDGIEYQMYWALREMCTGLKNVTWDLERQPVAIVDLYGAKMLVAHGDTEPKMSDPDTKAEQNALELYKVNASRQYGCEFQLATFGHFHKARYQPRIVQMIFNGALIPPNGHARSSGYIAEINSQTLWEAVEGHPVGDLRCVEVGPAQDHDERLGTLIPPFRLAA